MPKKLKFVQKLQKIELGYNGVQTEQIKILLYSSNLRMED